MSQEKFEVGGFAYYSWGYDQTNIDWFKVVRRNEKSVWFVPVKSAKEYNHFMSGQSVPVDEPILFKEDWKKVGDDYEKVLVSSEFRKSIKNYSWQSGQGGEVARGDFGGIYPWDGRPKHFSEYA